MIFQVLMYVINRI